MMDHTYWHKQTPDEPLFPDLLWSRPENQSHAGKILIIGGNQNGFASIGEAYNYAKSAGIGTARILLPNALQKVLKQANLLETFENIDFGSSTPSGSFAKTALGHWLDNSAWSDGVLLAGELGHNSETALLVESYLGKYSGQLTATGDSADYCISLPSVIEQPNTLLVLSLSQLQKLAQTTKFSKPFTSGMDLLNFVSQLHEFTTEHSIALIVKHLDQIVVAVNGEVCTTKVLKPSEKWQLESATKASVWWIQNPSQPFQAFTTSIIKI